MKDWIGREVIYVSASGKEYIAIVHHELNDCTLPTVTLTFQDDRFRHISKENVPPFSEDQQIKVWKPYFNGKRLWDEHQFLDEDFETEYESLKHKYDIKPYPVKDIYSYWSDPPPKPSNCCEYWVERIKTGNWKPNKRIRRCGYDDASRFYGVYVWEYLNVIQPLLQK